MVKKMKASSCKGRWCQTHLFSMKTRLVLSDASFEETIRLCPKFNREKKTLESTMPMLNMDGKIYTPLFILQEDRGMYASHDERNRQIFQDNCELQECQISEIMMPRITTERKHCKICKVAYQDYQEVLFPNKQHISSREHREAVRDHPYSALIVDLAQNFKLTKHQQKIDESHGTITDIQHQSIPQSEGESSAIDKETTTRDKYNIFRKEDEENDL